jgi:hypothetical protein
MSNVVHYVSDLTLSTRQSGCDAVQLDTSTVGMKIVGQSLANDLGIQSTPAAVGVGDETCAPLAIPGGRYGSVQVDVLVDGPSKCK